MKAVLLLRATSPITHGESTAGNRAIIRREKVDTPLGVRSVPVLSGNGLRHRLFREPIADDLAGGWQVTKERLRWLYNGGELAKTNGKFDKIINVDTKRIARCRELFPHVESLGCTLPDTPVAGKLKCGVGWLACRETQSIIQAILPDGWMECVGSLCASHEYVSDYDYYRHDAAKQRPEQLTEEDRDELEFANMPHGGEHVIPGAAFVVALHADGLSEIGASALVYALERWAAAGATVGGQSARGHGQVEPMLWTDPEVDSTAYQEHLSEQTDAMREFLDSLY